MAATRVLVVDDSLTMRALISGALERIADVEVVGVARGADEARDMAGRLFPDVMTLDIEMPGMSGLDYLAEVMERRPMPVIMFSSRTEAGADASIEALRLGAVDCFPKPRAASADELDKIMAKLARRIKAAKGGLPRKAAAALQAAATAAPLAWNGRLLAIGGEAASTKALFELFGTFPTNCPPTLVVQHLGAGLADAMIRKLGDRVAPRVVLAAEGMAIEQGTIYFAAPGACHMIAEDWPNGRIRMLAREPVAGERPSISLLFASVAKAAATEAVGLLLGNPGGDGTAGMTALRAAGGHGLAPDDRGTAYVLARRLISQPVPHEDLARTILRLCTR